jgi:hypothetical protein
MRVKRSCSLLHKRIILSMLMIVICLVTGILVGCATQRADSAGRINGVYIKRQDFMTSLRGHFTGFMLEKDRAPDDNEKKELYRQTWKDITKHVILKDYFSKYGIKVTQKEVLDTLLNNVPASVKKSPIFQTNGVFDRTKYVQELLSESSTQLDWLKKYYYEYYVPLARLKPELQKKGIISRKELEDLNRILNSIADIDWVVFDPQKTDAKVTQSDIDNYYHSNLKNYEIKPAASFGYTLVPVRYSQDDIEIAKTRIDSIYFAMYQGKTYSVMVERFSQSSTYTSGGALGFRKTDELSDNVIKALEGLNKNDITRPVRVGNSWSIYQLLERTKNLVNLNELVINIVPGEETRSEAKDRAIQLRDLSKQLGLEVASREMSLNYKQSGTVEKDSLWLSDAEASAYLIDRAFTQKPGSLLEPVYAEAMQAWVVAEVIDVQPFNYKTVMSVSDEIADVVLVEKQKAKGMDNAEQWAQKHKTNQMEMARQSGHDVISTTSLDINGVVLSEPVRKAYFTIISDYFNKKPPSPVYLGNMVLLPIIINVYASNPPIFMQRDVSMYYFDNVNTEWFDKWMDKEIKNSNVNIWFTYP